MMLFILDENLETKCTLSSRSSSKNAFVFMDDVLNERINEPSVFQFSCVYNHPNAKYISEGVKVVFKNPNNGLMDMFTVTEIETTHELITVYCEHASLDLLNNICLPTTINKNNIDGLKILLEETNWEVSPDSEWVDAIEYKVEGYSFKLEEIKKFAEAYGCELEFYITFKNNRVEHQYVKTAKKVGKDIGKRFSYKKDLTDVVYKVSRTNVINAVVGVGKNDTLMTKAEWKKGVNGAPIDKPINQYYVALEEEERGDTLIFGKCDVDSSDPATILQKSWEYLQENKIPHVTYECNPLLLGGEHEKVAIADTVYVRDEVLNLMLEARVQELQTSFTNPQNNTCVLSNFIPKESNITKDMKDIQAILNAKENKWDEYGEDIRDAIVDIDGKVDQEDFNSLGVGLNVFINTDSFTSDNWVDVGMDIEELEDETFQGKTIFKIDTAETSKGYKLINLVERGVIKADVPYVFSFYCKGTSEEYLPNMYFYCDNKTTNFIDIQDENKELIGKPSTDWQRFQKVVKFVNLDKVTEDAILRVEVKESAPPFEVVIGEMVEAELEDTTIPHTTEAELGMLVEDFYKYFWSDATTIPCSTYRVLIIDHDVDDTLPSEASILVFNLFGDVVYETTYSKSANIYVKRYNIGKFELYADNTLLFTWTKEEEGTEELIAEAIYPATATYRNVYQYTETDMQTIPFSSNYLVHVIETGGRHAIMLVDSKGEFLQNLFFQTIVVETKRKFEVSVKVTRDTKYPTTEHFYFCINGGDQNIHVATEEAEDVWGGIEIEPHVLSDKIFYHVEELDDVPSVDNGKLISKSSYKLVYANHLGANYLRMYDVNEDIIFEDYSLDSTIPIVITQTYGGTVYLSHNDEILYSWDIDKEIVPRTASLWFSCYQLERGETATDYDASLKSKLNSFETEIGNLKLQLTEDSLVSTITNSNTWKTVMNQKVTIDDLTGYAKLDDVTNALAGENILAQMNNVLREQAQDGSILRETFITSSQLSQTAEEINANFKYHGSLNLIKDSLFHSGVNNQNWVIGTTNSNSTGLLKCFTSGLDLDASGQLNFNSALHIDARRMSASVYQTFGTVIGEYYAFSYYYKVADESSNVLRAELTSVILNQDNEVLQATEREFYELTDGYVLVAGTFKANTNSCKIMFTVGEGAQVFITGIMVNKGKLALAWLPAEGELYNTNVKMDIEGLKVVQTDTNGTPIGYTVVSPTEFAGYWDSDGDGSYEKIFYLNRDAVVSKRSIITHELVLNPLKIVAIHDNDYQGWAVIPSTSIDYELVENEQDNADSNVAFPPLPEITYPDYEDDIGNGGIDDGEDNGEDDGGSVG